MRRAYRSRPFRPGVSRSNYGDLKFSRMAEFTVVTADSVNVTVSSNITQFPMQKRFQKGLTILQLKVTYSATRAGFCLQTGL